MGCGHVKNRSKFKLPQALIFDGYGGGGGDGGSDPAPNNPRRSLYKKGGNKKPPNAIFTSMTP